MNDALHEALRRAADDTGLVFDATGQDLLRRARRRARHRLLASAAAAVILAVAAAGIATAVLPGLLTAQAPPPAVQPPAVQPPGSAKILASCPTSFTFPHGSPQRVVMGARARVITADVSPSGTSAFILSSDRQYYLECNLSARGRPAFSRLYDVLAAPTGHGFVFNEGRALDQSDQRRRGWFSYCDRFPAEVAKVRLDFDGGGHVFAPAVDGFVAFNRWRPRGSSLPTHITLYDKHGNVLASSEWGHQHSLLPGSRGVY